MYITDGTIDIIDNEIILSNFSGSGKINLFPHVYEFNIYESILNNTLSAEFLVSEGLDILNNLPANGEEFIELSIITPDRKISSYRFFVESIIGTKPDKQGLNTSYVLRCVTEDYLKNSFTLYSKKYNNIKYDDAVSQVLYNDLSTSKPLELEPTKGIFDHTVNRVRPFQVMDLLTERAVSKNYKSSSFYFYEDNEAYRFVTIEHLIESRKQKVENFTFYYDVATHAADVVGKINIRNILNYQTIKQGSSIEKILQGGIRNQVRQFDIYHGTYWEKQEYINQIHRGNFKNTDGSVDMNSDFYNSYVSKNPSVSTMTIKDSTRPEMEHNKNLPYKKAFRTKESQFDLKIKVYGDTSLLVGDIIGVSVPELTGKTGVRNEQKHHTGNYLVRELRHKFQKSPNRNFDHYMILDLMRPNMKNDLA